MVRSVDRVCAYQQHPLAKARRARVDLIRDQPALKEFQLVTGLRHRQCRVVSRHGDAVGERGSICHLSEPCQMTEGRQSTQAGWHASDCEGMSAGLAR